MIFTALGATMISAAFGGYYVIKNRKNETKETDILTQCFHKAGLYTKDDMLYPTVTRRELHTDHELIEFRLPIGVQPRKVWRSSFVFKQAFGDYIDLEGEASTFILRVYKAPLSAFDYEYEQIPLDGYKLPVVVGRTRREWIVYDMVSHPHLLVAGETGSGKSTALRAMITTWLLTTPLELYLADLKRSEFHVFRNHANEVVNDAKGLLRILEYISGEMKRRGDLCDWHEVSNVLDLPEPPPPIVLVVDEFAMLKKDKKIMVLIGEITAIGRSNAVFFCGCLQRGSADVIDSVLKSNLTVRIAFKHEDAINSRITLGCEGAENLDSVGRGLIKHGGLKEFQSPYLSLEKAKYLLQKKNTL